MVEASLSDLCGICYTKVPIYRCPRCSIRTCSLPCTQRHKQRASCNGVRDPSKYLKKSQLATPAGFDHDYNFLTKLEHEIGKAEGEQQDNTGGRHGKRKAHHDMSHGEKTVRNRWHQSGPLQKYLRDNHITVARAPTGMSRQKENGTRHLPRAKKIIWTVEWLDATGSRFLSEVEEDVPIKQAHAGAVRLQSRKRKREEEMSSGIARARVPGSTSDDKEETSGITQSKTAEAEAVGEDVGEIAELLAPHPSTKVDDDAVEQATDHECDQQALLKESESEETALDSPDAPSSPTIIVDTPPSPQDVSADQAVHYYLLKPQISTKEKVLIPLSPDKTLTSLLRDRTVLEYPTIYTLSVPTTQLPSGFTSEETYMSSHEATEQTSRQMLPPPPPPPAPGLGASGSNATRLGRSSRVGQSRDQQSIDKDRKGEEEKLDAQAILQMLKRDLRS